MSSIQRPARAGLPGKRNRHWRTVLARIVAAGAVLSAGLLSACSRNEPPLPPPFEAREHGDYPGLVLEGEEAEYRIGVGDMIGLRVQRHPEFEGEVKVGPSGKVTLPLSLDRVDVAGLTVGEAEARVAEAIRPYVRLAPKVRLEIARPDSRFVYVLGAVARPGKLSVRDEQVFVREAVVRAGLPLRTAALRRTKLVSSTPDYHASRKIDLNAILYGGDLRENYELKPGDIVWVPRSFVSEIVWHAKQVLEPFAVLIGMDSTATRLSKVPTLDATGGDGNDN